MTRSKPGLARGAGAKRDRMAKTLTPSSTDKKQGSGKANWGRIDDEWDMFPKKSTTNSMRIRTQVKYNNPYDSQDELEYEEFQFLKTVKNDAEKNHDYLSSPTTSTDEETTFSLTNSSNSGAASSINGSMMVHVSGSGHDMSVV